MWKPFVYKTLNAMTFDVKCTCKKKKTPGVGVGVGVREASNGQHIMQISFPWNSSYWDWENGIGKWNFDNLCVLHMSRECTKRPCAVSFLKDHCQTSSYMLKHCPKDRIGTRHTDGMSSQRK